MEPKRKDIDGLTFIITQLPAWDAFDIINDLTAIVGPALGALGALGKGDAGVSPEKLAENIDVGKIIASAFAALPAADRKRLVRLILSGVKVERIVGDKIGEPRVLDVFDEVFKGKVATVMKLVAASAEVNFGDFFELGRGAFSRVRAAMLKRMAEAMSSSAPVLESNDTGPAGA